MINVDNAMKDLLKSDRPQTGYRIEVFRTTGTLLPSNTLYPSDTLYPLAGGEAAIVIEHDRIVSETVKIVNSIADSGDIVLGKCNSAMLTFQCADVTELYAGDELVVTLLVGEAEIPFGAYKIASIKKSADRRFRTITAYDRMTLFDVNVADWYNGLWAGGATAITIALLRYTLCDYIGVPCKPATLINDNLIVNKTVLPTEISGREILEAICEINGVFGTIDIYGQVNFISLDTSSAVEEISVGLRKTFEYEDYAVSKISQLVIRQENNDVGASVGDGNNVYIMQGNFLVFGKTSAQLTAIATTIYNHVKNFTYVPARLSCRGLPYLTVGDCVDVKLTNGTSKRTIIMSLALSGVQALNNDITATGSEKREETYGVSKSIIQLQGKSNTLERTVENNILRVSDLESGFTEISQSWDNLTLTSNSPTGANYATLTLKTTTDQQGEIALASANVSISGVVTFTSLSTSGQSIINGDNITTGFIRSQNFQPSVSGMSINLTDGSIWAPNFHLSQYGNISCSNAYISGTIIADGGYIGQISAPWYIGGESSRAYIFNGKSSFDNDSTDGLYIGTDGIAIGKSIANNGQGVVRIWPYGGCTMENISTKGIYFQGETDYIKLDSSNNRLKINGYNGVFINERQPVATMSAYPNVQVGLDVNVSSKVLTVYYNGEYVGYAQLV